MKFEENTLRDALGKFATGVCVVTTHPEGYQPLGVTVNSFTSVSLDPPLILWCLKKDTECFETFDAAGHFVVNVLASTQKELSNRYANKDSQILVPESYHAGVTGSPVMEEVLAAYECRLANKIEGGDHIILIGEVIDHITGPGTPLLYYAGQYCEPQENVAG